MKNSKLPTIQGLASLWLWGTALVKLVGLVALLVTPVFAQKPNVEAGRKPDSAPMWAAFIH
jgi:hypothetical protein